LPLEHGVKRITVRLFGRSDTSLAAALVVGGFLLFHQPLRVLFVAASDVERQYHLDLVQSLVVLSAVLAFHQYRKRQDANTELAAAAAEGRQAQLRLQELERLVGLGRAMAIAVDFTGLHHAWSRYLPRFTQDRSSWLLICQQGCWDVLVRDADDRRPAEELESIAQRGLAAAGGDDAIRIDGMVCFPMIVGGKPVGLVLVKDEPVLSAQDCRGIEAAVALAAISVRNVQTLIETRENSLRDGLTGCFNRAHAMETLTSELRRAQRGRTPLSMIMFDVDEFKRVNDTYGHLAGDHVLAEVGARLSALLRTSDVKCRYGGDEFLLILPDTPAAGAGQLAESIRREISRIALPAETGGAHITVSSGVVTATREELDARAFIARADRALYTAKHAGRNRVCAADADTVVAARLRLVSAAG